MQDRSDSQWATMSASQLEGSTEQWENRVFGYGLSRYKSGHRIRWKTSRRPMARRQQETRSLGRRRLGIHSSDRRKPYERLRGTGTRATRGRPDEPTIKQAHHALSKNVLREDTHPHNVSRQWKQKDSHLKATICGRFVIPRKTKTAICGRPDRFQASKDPNQYPLDEIFLGRLPHITEIIFLKCQKLPHIGHFKLKTRHRHITFFVRSKTAFRKRHHHRRRGYRFCGGRVRAAIRRVPYRRAHGCRDATACAFRPPPH